VGYNPEESTQHSEHGESLKSRNEIYLQFAKVAYSYASNFWPNKPIDMEIISTQKTDY